MAVYRLGLTRPLPMPPRTACAYAEHRRRGLSPDNAAAVGGPGLAVRSRTGAEWGEFDDGDHRRVGFERWRTWWPTAPTAYLWPTPDAEPHLFGLLASRVWLPLLRSEVIQP